MDPKITQSHVESWLPNLMYHSGPEGSTIVHVHVHVESWTSPLFYTRFHTFCTFMDHGQWSTVVHKLFFLHFEKSHVESWTHNDKKSCPIEQDIVLTGSMIVHEISMQ